MSKYTTEVRFICETEAGLSNSKGYSDVDEIINESWNKIFDNSWSAYDVLYKPILCKKILKHFYTREICAETVGLWKLWLNQRMSEIMPYYNELYKSTLLEYNPLYDVDYKTEGNRKIDEGETTERSTESNYTRTDNTTALTTNNLSSQRTDNLVETNSGSEYNLYSDTPQGALTGVESETYLTNARKITTDNTRNNSGTQTEDNTGTQEVTNSGTVKNDGNDTENSSRNMNNTQDYAEHVVGKRGSTSYAKMVAEFRESIINVDMMIIDELSDLFFNLW